MDHRWGRNITDYGLGDLGATMASPLHDRPQELHLNVLAYGGTKALYAQVPTDTSTPYTIAAVDPRPGHPHFPYGYWVDPDAPV